MSFQETDKFIKMILNIEQNIASQPHNFNYLLYYSLYPDLNITSFQQLLHHYLTVGVLEGRIKNKTDFYTQYPLFDYKLYCNLNKDIKVALEKKYVQSIGLISLSHIEYYSIIHYFTVGQYQGRVISNTDLSNIAPNPNGYPLNLAYLDPPVVGNDDVITEYANLFIEVLDANLYVIEDALPDSDIVNAGNIGSVLYVSNTFPSKVLYSNTVRQLEDVLYITAANINNLEVRNNANIGNDFVQISPESLFIAGNTTIDGNLTVDGLIIRNYSRTVNTMVYVNDESYIYQQNVNVTGNIIAGGNLYVDGNLSTDSYSRFYHGLGSLGYVKLAYTVDSVDINVDESMFGSCSLELTEIGGSYVVLENLFFRHDYEWTIEFFIKLVSLPGSIGAIITIGDFSLELTPDGYLIINVSTENSTSTTLLSTATWYHIVVVYTGNTNESYTLYIDGDSDITISADNVSLTSLTIGNENLSIAGYISELRYSSCARYTESFTSPTEEFTIDDYTVVINHFNTLDDFFGYNYIVSADMLNVIVYCNLVTEQFIHSSLGLDIGSNLFIDLGGNLFTSGNVGIGTDTPEYNLDVIGDGKISGNLIVGDIIVSNLIVNDTIVGTLSTSAQPNITSVGNLTSLTIDGDATVANLTATGFIYGSINITSIPYVTSLSTQTNLTVSGNAVVGNLVTSGAIIGTLATAAQPNITSLGNLTSLTVNGNLTTTGYISGALNVTSLPDVTYVGALSNLTVSGNAVVGNLVANLVTSGTIVGTLATAAQPNITYLGSLSNLTVSGNAVVGNLVTSGTIVGTLATAAQPNITYLGSLSNLTVSGNAVVGNLVTSGAIIGTLATAAQPNITYLGSLSNLTVSGNTTVGGNLVTSGAIVGTLATAAQPNITYLGSLSNLTVSGNATVGGNLTVSGNATIANATIGNLTMSGTSSILSIKPSTNVLYIGSSTNLYKYFEFGPDTTNLDFISSGLVNTDYNGRIQCTGGTATTGSGTLTYYATTHSFSGVLGVSGATTLSSTLGVSGVASFASSLRTNYSTLPTFTTADIGYTASYVRGSDITISASNTVYNVGYSSGVTLGVGVWYLYGIIRTYITSGSCTITGMYYGFSTSSTSWSGTGYTASTLIQLFNPSSYTVSTGNAQTQPIYSVSQVFIVSSSTTIYLVCNAYSLSASTLQTQQYSGFTVTRIA